jgi:hypothetical protein
MSRPEVTGRKAGRAQVIEGPPAAVYDIKGFCVAHKISPDHYYRLQRIGEGPRVMKVGARTLISHESAAEWRRAHEKPSKPAAE